MGQSITATEDFEKRRRSNPPKKGEERDAVEVIELSPEASRVFAEAILSPPEPTAALVRAAALHRQLVINE